MQTLDWCELFRLRKIHLVTVASCGMTTCDAAMRICGIPHDDAWSFVQRVNEDEEMGTVLPSIPLTLVPVPRPNKVGMRAFLEKTFREVLATHMKFARTLPVVAVLNGDTTYYPREMARLVACEVFSRNGVYVTFGEC